MSDEIKKSEKLEQAAESSAPSSEQELKNAEGIASGEAQLPEEELNKVAGGFVKPIGGKPTKYMPL